MINLNTRPEGGGGQRWICTSYYKATTQENRRYKVEVNLIQQDQGESDLTKSRVKNQTCVDEKKFFGPTCGGSSHARNKCSARNST